MKDGECIHNIKWTYKYLEETGVRFVTFKAEGVCRDCGKELFIEQEVTLREER